MAEAVRCGTDKDRITKDAPAMAPFACRQQTNKFTESGSDRTAMEKKAMLRAIINLVA